jgi:hypothetical protein
MMKITSKDPIIVYLIFHPGSQSVSRMLPSPTKSMTLVQKVRFNNDSKTVTPLKGVLKKPQVVVPRCVHVWDWPISSDQYLISDNANASNSGWDDKDVFTK